MAGIRQSIPNYAGGISEQPDQLKRPGQVKDIVNGVPDAIRGLFKRPGTARVGTAKLANVQSDGSYFYYHRDGEEGSYIGQIAANGTPRIWKAEGDNPGVEQTIAYGTGGETAIKTYLSNSNPENLQFLTINDTTFVTNRDTNVATTGTTGGEPDDHFAYIDLLRTENGRQYGLNIYDNNTAGTTINRATRIKISSDTLSEANGTGHCPGIGTQVFAVTAAGSYSSDISWVKDASDNTVTSGKENLIFRLTALGQQGQGAAVDDGAYGPSNYRCTYSRDVDLLHGGEGWVTGDTTQVTLTSASTNYNYVIEVIEHEAITVKGNIKAVRPSPTPFDADTAVTADTILGGIISELTSTGITATVIGNGLYLTKSSSFNVEVTDPDLMRVMQSSINNVTELPTQCKHGYIVKVSNARMSEEDDYYLKFQGENDRDGAGGWEECAKPGIVLGFDDATMPHVIQRTSIANLGQANEIATFTVKQFDYADREVGDDNTNPIARFNGNPINKVLFFRNRIVFLSEQYVICSRPGTADKPDFWVKTALTSSNSDPIDIASSSTLPSKLFDGIETQTGLVLFSTNHQFLLASDDTVFNPDTAKCRSLAVYNYNEKVPPISLGVSVGFIDNSGKYSRFLEMAAVKREGPPILGETSLIAPTLLEKDIVEVTNSRENSIVLFGKTNSNTVIGYKYLTEGNERRQAGWFKWKFNRPYKYHFIINDQYFYLDTDNFLQVMSLTQTDSDISIDQDSVNYLIHLDNYTTVSSGTYDTATKKTTFANQSDWIDDVGTTTNKLVLVDTDSNTAREGRYAECTVVNTDDFTVPGDWSSATLNIGYLYDYQVDLPRVYVTQTRGERTVSDVNSSLIVHRLKFNFGKLGLYETTLTRLGKDPYTEIYESAELDEYLVSDAPYLDEAIKTIPVYENNRNVDITLKSTHPSPSTLRSMSWEGDYTTKYYKRA